MTLEQQIHIKELTDKPVICLNLPDNFSYRDPELMELIKVRYTDHILKDTFTSEDTKAD
jgi:predicted protein tyrosine phosphatase